MIKLEAKIEEKIIKELKTTQLNGKFITFGEVEIEYEGKPYTVKIRRIRFGEMNDLNKESAKLTYVNGMTKIDFDQKAMNELCLLKSVFEAPFPLTLDGIRDLDNVIATKLVSAFNELNTPTEKKKEI